MLERDVVPRSEAYRQVAELYEAAFPAEEQMELSLLERAAGQDAVDFVAYYTEDNAFCGFTYSVDTGTYLYLAYFAVRSELRSQGYGSRILERLKARFPGRAIVLEIEPLDYTAVNSEQRTRRFSFYERNGFAPTGYSSFFDGLAFTVLSTRGQFDAHECVCGVERATEKLICLDLRKQETE